MAWVQGVNVARRELVRGYYVPLWVWHRLDAKRWEMSRIQLREQGKKKVTLDVDHSVAHALWERKLATGLPTGASDKDDAISLVNRLGNCSLLEKSFNISRSDKTFKSFMQEVHELKTHQVTLDEWAASLGLSQEMLDPEAATVDAIATAVGTRQMPPCGRS